MVLLLSAAATIVTYYFSPVYFAPDSDTYLKYAYNLANHYINPNLFWRTPGYPLLLIATGYVHFDSLAILLYLQGFCAFLTPLLLQATLRPYSKPLALVAASACIFSLAPYRYQMMIYPDQLHLFLPVLMAFLVMHYVRSKHIAWLVSAYAVIAALSFFRPTMMFFIPLLLLLLWLPDIRRKKNHYAAHIVMVLAIIASHMLFTQMKDQFRTPEQASSFAGSQLFFNIYMHSGGENAFATSNGLYTVEFRDRLTVFLRNKRKVGQFMRDLKYGTPEEFYNLLYSQYQNNPAKLTSQVLQSPNEYYYWMLFAFTNWVLGRKGDAIITQVSLEQLQTHPHLLAKIVHENGKAYFWGPNFRWKRASLTNEKLMQTDGFEFLPNTSPAINRWWFPIYLSIVRIATLGNLIGLALIPFYALSRRDIYARRAVALTATVFIASSLLQTLPLALLTAPEFRYQSSTLPSMILSACFGFYMLARYAACDLQSPSSKALRNK